MELYFIASFTFTIAFLITPVVRWGALRLQAVAQENHRTIHTGVIPKLGGVAIAFAFIGVSVFYLLWSQKIAPGPYLHAMGILIGSFLILMVGFADDIRGISCYGKLALQSMAALVAISFGVKIEALVLPFVGTIPLGDWAYPTTILWIVGISNALNLIDGLDGLAVGITLLVASTLFICGLVFSSALAVLPIILIGAMMGFLPYNYRPAKIFLGDSGSLVIGYLLACLAIEMSGQVPGTMHLLIPVVALALPILDTIWAIIRRLKRHEHPFHADREHIHHRLLYLGFSHKKAVYILWTTTLALQCFALMQLLDYQVFSLAICLALIPILIVLLRWLELVRSMWTESTCL